MNAKYLDELKKVMTVTILTPEQKAAFQEAVQPVYDQFADEIGPDLIKAVQKNVKEFQAKK
jgi:TRAP-type C4-dicarboxylate transport system substrate-binding protein